MSTATKPSGEAGNQHAGQTHPSGTTSINKALARVIEVPFPLRDSVVYEDGVVYVSTEATQNGHYYAYEGTLKRHRLFRERRVVPLPDIKARRTAQGRKGNAHEALDAGLAVRMMREIIQRAVEVRASDIHLFLYANSHCEVDYRIDGFMRHVIDLKPDDAVAMIRAIYTKMDGVNAQQWSEREICFGTIKSHDLIPNYLHAIRFSSSRNSDGAMVALRMLPKEQKKGATIDDLGISPALLSTIKEMSESATGVMLVSGPTGAGKSTFLKYQMEWMYEKFPFHHTIGVEDPSEYKIRGVKSIDVLIQDNEDPSVDERSLAWQKVIATAMRLDPNRMMIGEIRDGGAATAAIRAAITGHPVYTTIHANDSSGAINRFIDLLYQGGMYNPLGVVCDSKNLIGATAQRLMPALCPDCKIPLVSNEDRIGGKSGRLYCELVGAIENFEAASFGIYLKGDGCDRCAPEFKGEPEARKNAPGIGIFGRVMVLEVFHAPQKILDIIAANGVPAAKLAWLKSGGTLLIDDAIRKVLAGVTSPEFIGEFVGPIITAKQVIEGHRIDGNVSPITAISRQAVVNR